MESESKSLFVAVCDKSLNINSVQQMSLNMLIRTSSGCVAGKWIMTLLALLECLCRKKYRRLLDKVAANHHSFRCRNYDLEVDVI